MTAEHIRKLAKTCDDFADMACDNAFNPEGAMQMYQEMSTCLYNYANVVEGAEKVLKGNV